MRLIVGGFLGRDSAEEHKIANRLDVGLALSKDRGICAAALRAITSNGVTRFGTGCGNWLRAQVFQCSRLSLPVFHEILPQVCCCSEASTYFCATRVDNSRQQRFSVCPVTGPPDHIEAEGIPPPLQPVPQMVLDSIRQILGLPHIMRASALQQHVDSTLPPE